MIFRRFIMVATVFFSIFFSIGCFANTDASASSPTYSSIPKSSERLSSSHDRNHFPPWNPSPNIDDNGFLIPTYERISGEWEKEVKLRRKDRNRLHNSPATIRQVPGDGSCLFHSISTCLFQATNSTHLDMRCPDTMEWLYRHSAKLRQLAVDCLEERRKLLFLQGNEYLNAKDLVDAAAAQYDISGSQYCDLMRGESYWGGGPEIVALSNVLQRPIHVYELHVPDGKDGKTNNKGKRSRESAPTSDCRRSITAATSSSFVLRRMACFGSPKFDRSSALHILSADSRFPDVNPNDFQPQGNHFLAIFPVTSTTLSDKQQSDHQDGKKQKRRFWTNL